MTLMMMSVLAGTRESKHNGHKQRMHLLIFWNLLISPVAL